MDKRRNIPPCLVCGRVIYYLWTERHRIGGNATNLDNACDAVVRGCYGSMHDTDEFRAAICDECVANALKAGRLSLVSTLFGNTTNEEEVK